MTGRHWSWLFLLPLLAFSTAWSQEEEKPLSEQFHPLAMGADYAPLEVTASAEAEIFVDNERWGKTPITIELVEGEHTVTARRKGYTDSTRKVTLRQGQRALVNFDLKRTMGGQVTVRTEPKGGRIRFQGQEMGEGSADLGRLGVGSYEASAMLHQDDGSRLEGEVSFSIKEGESKTVVISLNRRLALYQGEWLERSVALQREEERYRGQRVRDPVHLTVRLDGAGRLALSRTPELDFRLHRMMRVGDRLTFDWDGHAWSLWKRHREPGDSFTGQVKRFLQREAPFSLSFADDTPAVTSTLADGPRDLASIFHALNRARSPWPMVDLERWQVEAEGEVIQRSEADGDITLLVIGPSPPVVKDHDFERAGNLYLAHLPAGNGSIHLQWENRPDRLLAVAGVPLQAAPPLAAITLQRHEKKLLSWEINEKVASLVRYTLGPDHPDGLRQPVTPRGVIASRMDLSRDEAGPHDKEGQYHRVWILHFLRQGQPTQRQLSLTYRVGP